MRFDQCHVQHTVCTPSRCSFTTGWYPHVRGHRTLWHPPADEPNILRYFKQDGYQVHWWGKNDLLAPDSYADSVTEHHRPNAARVVLRICSLWVREAIIVSCVVRLMRFFERAATEDCVSMLEQHQESDEPFFYLHTWGMPHCPFTCPQPWYDMVNPDDYHHYGLAR